MDTILFQGNEYMSFLNWVYSTFIPHVYVGKWYNGMNAGKIEDGLIDDRSSFLVGMPRLRQLRVRPGMFKGLEDWY